MCNWMKGSISPSVFVHRIEHILTNLRLVEGTLYPTEFENSTNVCYHEYKKRAAQRSLAFDLSNDEFSCIVNQPCYLCGKEQIGHHKNGIDRVDNTKGYVEGNVKSCCWNCNYMKRDYTYDNLMDKFNLIYEYQKVHPMAQHHMKNIKNIVVGNKLTTEEKAEKGIVRKKANKKHWLTSIQTRSFARNGSKRSFKTEKA